MAGGGFRGGKVRRLSSAKAEQEVTGPLQVLQRLPGATTHIVARTRDPVPSDCPLLIQPTVPSAECPSLDLICVPGGFGVDQAMEDEETIAFVRREGARAHDVTSVCRAKPGSSS